MRLPRLTTALALVTLALAGPTSATAQTCDPLPGAASSGRFTRQLRSAALRDARRTLRPALRTAKRESPGMRRWNRHSPLTGATYGERSYRLGSAACGGELEKMVTQYLTPSPGDDVYYAEARLIPRAVAIKIDAAFDADRRSSAAETGAVMRLAEQIEAFAAAHPDLLVFIVNGGWADAVGSRHAGVALVDPTTREAVWLYGESVWSA